MNICKRKSPAAHAIVAAIAPPQPGDKFRIRVPAGVSHARIKVSHDHWSDYLHLDMVYRLLAVPGNQILRFPVTE